MKDKRFVRCFLGGVFVGGMIVPDVYPNLYNTSHKLVVRVGFGFNDTYYLCYPGCSRGGSIGGTYMSKAWEDIRNFDFGRTHSVRIDENYTIKEIQNEYLNKNSNPILYPKIKDILECSNCKITDLKDLWFCEDWSENLVYDDWGDLIE